MVITKIETYIKQEEILHKYYITTKDGTGQNFIENKNIALSREQLLTNIWGYDFYGDDRTVDTHVKTLRNNLGKYRDLITTIRKVGYKFEYKEKDN